MGTEVVSGGPMAVGGIVMIWTMVDVVNVVEGVVLAVWGAESDRIVDGALDIVGGNVKPFEALG